LILLPHHAINSSFAAEYAESQTGPINAEQCY